MTSEARSTSKDVAQLAGVSRATVSQILNGRAALFTEATRARVLQAAAELDYHPSAAGRTLVRGSSDFVIALVPDTTFGANLQDLFEKMTEDLADNGLTLILCLATRTDESLRRLVSVIQPAAIYSMTTLGPSTRAMLDGQGVLLVDPLTAAVDFDYHAALGLLQANYLLDRGYKRLAFARLSDSRQDPFGDSRIGSVRAACHQAGLAEPVEVALGIDRASAQAALIGLRPPGVAVVCYNDDVATALLSAALSSGYRVPQDIALIGMDATPLSQLTLPPLTTVEYDLAAAVKVSAQYILQALGREVPDGLEMADVAFRIVPGGTT